MTHLKREIRIPIYWLVVGLCVMVASPILALIASVEINQHTIATNEKARNDARAESILRYCRLLGSQLDVYKEANTEVGKKAYDVWVTEYNYNHCQPTR